MIEDSTTYLANQFVPEKNGRKAYLASVWLFKCEKQINVAAEDIHAKLGRNYLITKNPGKERISNFKIYSN